MEPAQFFFWFCFLNAADRQRSLADCPRLVRAVVNYDCDRADAKGEDGYAEQDGADAAKAVLVNGANHMEDLARRRAVGQLLSVAPHRPRQRGIPKNPAVKQTLTAGYYFWRWDSGDGSSTASGAPAREEWTWYPCRVGAFLTR
jgi:hypothetical protein